MALGDFKAVRLPSLYIDHVMVKITKLLRLAGNVVCIFL